MTTVDIGAPTIEQIEARRDELAAEAREILARSAEGFADGDGERVDAINTELQALQARQQRMERVMRAASVPGASERASGAVAVPGTLGAARDDQPPTDVRGRALWTIERSNKAGHLADHAAEKATALVERAANAKDQSLAARWVTIAGDEHYRTAFAKLLADPDKGHLLWDAREQEAYRRVAELRAEMRAMSIGTDAAGGYMVPVSLDPAINLSSDGSTNPLRRIARVVQTTGSQWSGITSAGVTAEWKAEAAEAADASPTLAEVNIPVHFGDAFVPYSFEVGMDAVDFLRELTTLLVDGADQLNAAAYTTGTGIGQPTGVITALTAGSSVVATAAADTLAAADVFALQNALPPRFQARAQWCANLAIINTLRQFETTNGALKFPELAGGMLLNRPMNELSNMDGSVTAAANNYLLLYGDFSNFVIADRIGTTLELIPNLVGANRRPTGQRGAFLWYRTGSDVLVDNAFRVLNA